MKKIAKFIVRLVKGILLFPFYIAKPTFGLSDAEMEKMGIDLSRN